MRFLLLILFFLSGACGIVYWVTWTKFFALNMSGAGLTIAVLAAGMVGLALGGRKGGKWIGRRGNPLPVFGIIQGVMGIYSIAVPWVVKIVPHILGPFYDGIFAGSPFIFGLAQFALALPMLIIPTFLMGASLPVIARYFVHDRERLGWEVGRLFATGLFGAGAGTFVAGFVMLPAFGMTRTLLLAAALNIFVSAIALIAYLAFGKTWAKVPVDGGSANDDSLSGVEPAQYGKISRWVASVALACAGSAGMIYLVGWGRALTLCMGSNVYIPYMTVTIFVSGLALGGAIGARVADRLGNAPAAFGVVEMLIGFSAIWVMFGIGKLPAHLSGWVETARGNWSSLVSTEFMAVAVLLLAPTLLMGAVFPLAVKSVGMGGNGVDEPVGSSLMFSAVGAILGGVAGVFLLPLIGIENTVFAANFILWIAGGLLLLVSLGGSRVKKYACASFPLIIGIVAAFVVPRWNVSAMISGAYLPLGGMLGPDTEILFNKTGAGAAVSVTRDRNGNPALMMNGKIEAWAGIDMISQVLSAHIPALLSKNPAKVCVIGLSNGVTAGALTLYDSVKNIDVVEISPVVVEASKYFADWNHNVNENPKVDILVGDGRSHLLMTGKKYDVIVSDYPDCRGAWASSALTDGYFKSVARSLAPGGLFCFRLPAYDVDLNGFQMVMRTVLEVFPNVSLWEIIPGYDYIFIASTGDQKIDLKTFIGKIRNPAIQEDLARVNRAGDVRIFSHFVLSPRRCRMAAGEGDIHTDDKVRFEYLTPRLQYSTTNRYPEFATEVLRYRDDPATMISDHVDQWPPKFAEEIAEAATIRDLSEKGAIAAATNDPEAAMELFGKALVLAPGYPWLELKFNEAVKYAAAGYLKKGNIAGALQIYERGIGTYPKSSELETALGSIYMMMDKGDPAREHFDKAIELDPKNHIAMYNKGFIEFVEGNRDEAVQIFLKIVAINPGYAPAYNAMGQVYADNQQLAKAESYFRKAIEVNPSYADAYVNLGRILLQHKDESVRAQAQICFDKAIELDPKIAANEEFMKSIGRGTK